MNTKITLRNSKQNSFLNSVQTTHRHTLSQGIELKLESPTNRETSGFTSFQSLKSSSIHLKKLVKSPTSQIKSARQFDLNENFLNQRTSIVQMMQTFSNNYEIIQQSEPLENIDLQKLFPVEEQKKSQNNEIVPHESKLRIFELKQESNNWISINRFRFHYFSIKIQGQESPIQVYVKCDQSRLLNYRMYISTTASFPTKFNSEAVVQSKYFKYQDKKHNDKFLDKFLYIAIYSEEDCEISISFLYGNQSIKKQKPKRQKPNYDKYKYWWQQQKFDMSCETDKINSNLDTRQYSREARKEKLIQSQDQLDLRMKNAMSRKKELSEDKKMDLLSKYQASEALKEIRNQQKLKQRIRHAITKFQISWLGIFILIHLAENMKSMLDEAKKRSKYLAKGRLIVWKYRTTTMIKIKESGQNVDQRNLFKLCMTMCIFASHNKKRIKTDVSKVLRYFLTLTHQYCHFIQKHQELTYKVNYVKRVFRNLKQKEKAYKDRLWRILNKYAQEILHTLGAHFTNPKKRTYIIDSSALQKAMEDFLSQKKRKCQQFIQGYVREKDQKQKVVDLALNMMQPEMFDTPSYDDLYGIFRTYIHYKKMTSQQSQQQQLKSQQLQQQQ
ncbi:unnamed protein product (macronuclear) [Paramecium tetraurelia]|uniref:Uncharacterized protein n=1 Tax=Paramecium tetraurelia TaxID=5888 RepID=A0CKC3_PARTE|nr:uncharacterized protein GSPATT00000953001 [Paramecium tetraurelia]CAK71240.1 unnamed protein product [Paramecium tetraurelia]|eukprot:XP_001438637.1 hypothetical protein (macronuclear) [Paramecium tetraurelia strain d4-2]